MRGLLWRISLRCSLTRSPFRFPYILLATFCTCEDIHKVVALAVKMLSDSVFISCNVAGDLFYPIYLKKRKKESTFNRLH